MQEMQKTPRGFLGLINGMAPNEDLKEWTKGNLQERNSSGDISRAEVLRGIQLHRIDTAEVPAIYSGMPTIYNMPAMPKTSPHATEKLSAIDLGEPPTQQELLAQLLAGTGQASILFPEQDDDIYVEEISSDHTVDIIHRAVRKLGSMPTLIVVSNLRWLAQEELLRRIRYHHNGVRIPIVPSDGPCTFDVRVYGSHV